jgi:hypothetical protein
MGSPEEAGQPPRSSSAAPDPGTDQAAGAPPSPSQAAGRGRLSDDDVAGLEHDILAPDVSGIGGDVLGEIRHRREEDEARRESGEDDQALRHQQDQRWLHVVRTAGFTGLFFEIYWDQLTRYGLAVMMCWTRSGKIFKECRDKGRPVNYPADGVAWSDEERRSIVNETVAKALAYFLTDVLEPGRWNAAGGASLRTYFVGACLLQFPNVFNAWATKDERETHHRADVAVEDAEVSIARNACWGDPVGSIVADRDDKQQILAAIEDPLTRSLVEMVVFDGIRQNAAAEKLGITPGAAWARLDRYKQGVKKERDTR